MIQQEFTQIVRALPGYLDSNGGTVSTCLQLTFQCPNQVTDLFVVDVQVAVSGDAKLVAAINVETWKQAVDIDSYE